MPSPESSLRGLSRLLVVFCVDAGLGVLPMPEPKPERGVEGWTM